MSISERFNRVPAEQALRFEESQHQAQQASNLLSRLRSTREEAERLALDEISRTKAMQREEIEQHPEIQDLKRRLRNAQTAREAYNRQVKSHQDTKNQELSRLKAQEEQLLRRFADIKGEEERQYAAFERDQKARQVDESRLNALQTDFDGLKGYEDAQFVKPVKYMQDSIMETERELANFKATHPEPELVRAELKSIDAQVIKEEEALEKVRSDMFNWEAKREEAQKDLNRARIFLAH